MPTQDRGAWSGGETVVRRAILIALALFAALCGGVLLMGWCGTANIAHREFDTAGFLISAVGLVALSFKHAKPKSS